jgi:UDP-N-acetylmuramyl tripeptide synthase
MGKAACELSDRVVVTSDNPRFEEPRDIINEIEAGIKGRFSNYDIVIDRRQAIARALELASAGDCVLIAGKGHEDYQIIKDNVMPFDDCVVGREILRKMFKDESSGNSKNNTRQAAIR